MAARPSSRRRARAARGMAHSRTTPQKGTPTAAPHTGGARGPPIYPLKLVMETEPEFLAKQTEFWKKLGGRKGRKLLDKVMFRRVGGIYSGTVCIHLAPIGARVVAAR